ncbi:MAG TPA: CBS domain-containing protein [Gemmatales bacterium]|nr:CBS domain-containing protein [Gemmatales bacterium]
MSHVREVLRGKGSQVWTIDPKVTVLEAASLMNKHKIGALVVTDNDRVIGMFTERDILKRIVAEQRDPAKTPVVDVMTNEVVCCSPDTKLDEARGAMKNRRIRHLPVVGEDGKLLGLISIGDLNTQVQAENELTIFLLDEYIHGRT